MQIIKYIPRGKKKKPNFKVIESAFGAFGSRSPAEVFCALAALNLQLAFLAKPITLTSSLLSSAKLTPLTFNTKDGAIGGEQAKLLRNSFRSQFI